MTSPTCSRTSKSSLVRGVLAAALAVALLVGLGAGTAQADNLGDRRDAVKKAIVATKKAINSSKQDVSATTAKWEQSVAQLAQARRKLAVVNGRLSEARAADEAAAGKLAAATARLAAAEQELRQANEKVLQGEADVTAQRRLIGEAVRSAYQQQGTIAGYSVVLSSESTADLAQRVQWTTTVFDTSAAEMSRLNELLETLEKLKAAAASKRAEVAAVAAQVKSERQAAASQLSRTLALSNQAAAAHAKVAQLVVTNAKNRKAAQAELVADQREYNKLRADEARISAEIRRRAEAARRARLAAIAKAKAEAAKKHKKYVAPQESSKGFIYPVHATPGSPFGMRYHPILHVWRMHRGQDFGAACGAPLFAVADGKVASAGWQGGFGNYTVIDVGFINGRFVSVGYAHQSRMVVHAGERVRQGQVIGYVGTTGLSTGCHLHFQVYVNGGVVNPLTYL